MNYLEEWKMVCEARNSKSMDEDKFLDWKNRKLKNILSYVSKKSLYYSNSLKGLDFDNISLNTLNQLPTTSKNDLREAMYDILSGKKEDADFFYSTTGTTGKATPCPRSNTDIDINNISIKKHFKDLTDYHCDKNKRAIVAVFAPNELHSVCFTLGLVTRELGMCKLDIFPLSPVVGFERCFELLLDLKVNVLVCSPGHVMSLAEMSEAYGIDVKEDLSVELVLCTGELCSPFILETIENTWDAKAYNFMYGSQEAMCIALASPDIERGYLNSIETNFVYELLDLKGNSVQELVNEGELCLTMLIPGIKPLIRYRTGDWVRINSKNLHTNFTMQILGRIKDMVEINQKLYLPQELEALIYNDKYSIFSYQILIEKNSKNDDVVTIKVTAKIDADIEELRNKIIDNFKKNVDVNINIEMLPILNLETATGGWVSWKAARIVDNRGNNDIENISAKNLAKNAHDSL